MQNGDALDSPRLELTSGRNICDATAQFSVYLCKHIIARIFLLGF
ncbi:hypothetical protein [Mycoavidus sp. SF9855]|nr:hypothetical protein [Mycoavidus sp. SF9855]UUM21320.1 hypothetical protein NQD60_07755 [Mycoavidus sp. SF9855]